MSVWIYVLILVVGFVGLVKGADLFVDGSAATAKNLHVPSLIIGLTIVALGTSAPELAVSTSAALQGANEIALSNVVGSNVFNLLVVLGTCAVISAVPVDTKVLKRDFPLSMIFTVIVLFLTGGIASLKNVLTSGDILGTDMTVNVGMLGRLNGLIILVMFVLYIGYLIYDAKKHPTEGDEVADKSMGKCVALIIFGLILIIAGGQAVVISAKEIARAAGMTETLIGLTVVALGTSLPELVTSIVAARKNDLGLAVGNVVGSNIFNVLFILGVSTTVNPIAVNLASVFDLTILLAVSLVSFVFMATGKKINRAEGIMMILIYAAHVVFAVLR